MLSPSAPPLDLGPVGRTPHPTRNALHMPLLSQHPQPLSDRCHEEGTMGELQLLMSGSFRVASAGQNGPASTWVGLSIVKLPKPPLVTVSKEGDNGLGDKGPIGPEPDAKPFATWAALRAGGVPLQYKMWAMAEQRTAMKWHEHDEPNTTHFHKLHDKLHADWKVVAHHKLSVSLMSWYAIINDVGSESKASCADACCCGCTACGCSCCCEARAKDRPSALSPCTYKLALDSAVPDSPPRAS